MAKIGVISDIHGRDVKPAVRAFDEEDVDFVLVNGDIVDRYSASQREHLEGILRDFAEFPGEVLVIPGNHERRSEYEQAMDNIQRESGNIKDLSKGEVYVKGDFAIIPYGGSWDTLSDEYFRNDPGKDVKGLAEKFQNNEDRKIIFQTHGPPFGYGDIVGGRRRGSDELKDLIEGLHGNPIPLLEASGHTHRSYLYESPGKEIPTGREVSEGENVGHLALNACEYKSGRFAIAETVDDRISYRIRTA